MIGGFNGSSPQGDARSTNRDEFRAIVVTDWHVREFEEVGWEDQETAMDTAVNAAETWPADCIIGLGDMADNCIDRVRNGFWRLARCKKPVLWCIGNHDENETGCSESTSGNPNTTTLQNQVFKMAAPFYHSRLMHPPDKSFSILFVSLDLNIYISDPAVTDHPDHTDGDRIGYTTSAPPGGYYRQLGATQLSWLRTELANNPSDYLAILVHYPVTAPQFTDSQALGDEIELDGRPATVLTGHQHGNGRVDDVDNSSNTKICDSYKFPATLESDCHTRMIIKRVSGVPAVTQLDVHNFTNPGGWTFESPFAEVT